MQPNYTSNNTVRWTTKKFGAKRKEADWLALAQWQCGLPAERLGSVPTSRPEVCSSSLKPRYAEPKFQEGLVRGKDGLARWQPNKTSA